MRTLLRLSLLAAVAFFALLPLTHVQAQPSVTFTRIVNNWPTIELYLKATCNGQNLYQFTKNNFTVHENGREIPEFTLWCPDPVQRCATSAALVFDASLSMKGEPNTQAKAGGNAFIDLLDGIIDEAAIIYAGTQPVVPQKMTINKTALHGAVDALPAAGSSRIWDAIYVGLQELTTTGSNPCRAVLAFTDGADNGSVKTPDEIIALANRNRIRVFTIGYGETVPAQLETIALLTGGKYYHVPSPSQLVTIYQEISTIIFTGFLECLITYQASCQNGTVRNVDLTLTGVCGGTDTKTRAYRAPKDTSTYGIFDLILDDGKTVPSATLRVPLRIGYTGSSGLEWGDLAFSIHHTDELEFRSVSAPEGSLLHGASIIATPLDDGARIDVPELHRIANSGVLAELEFVVSPISAGTDATIRIDSMEFRSTCGRPSVIESNVFIYDYATPFIIAEQLTICDGSPVTLSCTPGFSDWQWSNGASDSTILVTAGGVYTVTAVNSSGDTLTSPPLEIIAHTLPSPRINPSSRTICNGESTVLSVNATYADYRWSNGERGRSINADAPGEYYADVMSPEGCWGRSDSILVVAGDRPVPKITGPLLVCPDGTYWYQTPYNPDSKYKWTIGGGEIVSQSDSNFIQVHWNDMHMHSLQVHETNTVHGCAGSDHADVTSIYTSPKVFTTDALEICPGTSTKLYVAPLYDTYEWSNGFRGDTLVVDQPGVYFCSVAKDSCYGISDTVTVSAIPAVQPALSGKSLVCQYETATYSAAEYDTDYEWIVEGGTITAGKWSPEIDVTWTSPDTGRVICIIQVGVCTGYDTIDVVMTPAAVPTVTVNGELNICQGDSVILIAEDGFTDYMWSDGTPGSRIVVTNSGSFYVTVTNANGCVTHSQTLHVDVWNYPLKQTITQNNSVLTIGGHATYLTYTWYRNGNKIPGSKGSITITETGTYTLEITSVHGCTTVCDPIVVTTLGVRTLFLPTQFTISPNPTSGTFEVALGFEQPTAFGMRVVNALGQTVYESNITERVTDYQSSIDLNNAPPGVYIFLLQSGGQYYYKKIIVR